jgi:hypothetical protein
VWKHLWKKWTLDEPAAFGDWLWEILVVQLAALLDRLTLRKIVAFIPVAVLVLAYSHSIPLPPELMLVGDVLAYIDIFSVILLLSLMSRAAAILFVVKRAAEHAVKFARSMLAGMQRLDFRHRREGRAKNRKCLIGRTNNDDDQCLVTYGVGWA